VDAEVEGFEVRTRYAYLKKEKKTLFSARSTQNEVIIF
jgi:hypothetical protein